MAVAKRSPANIDKNPVLGYDVYKVAHPDPSPFGAKRASFLCISQSFSAYIKVSWENLNTRAAQQENAHEHTTPLGYD